MQVRILPGEPDTKEKNMTRTQIVSAVIIAAVLVAMIAAFGYDAVEAGRGWCRTCRTP